MRSYLYGNSSLPYQQPADPDGMRVSLYPRSPFDEVAVVASTTIIELKANFGISVLRDKTTTAGSGSITNTAGSSEYTIATTASGSDSAVLDSAERGRYVPGMVGRTGIGMRRPTAPTGNQVAIWGYTDGTDGAYFGEDASGLFVAVKSGGTEKKFYQATWNRDRLDGTGDCGLTVDLTRGNIFQIEYAWYGYGAVHFFVLLPDRHGLQRRYLAHVYSTSGAVVFETPDLPIRASIDNAGTATAFTLYVGGRHYSVQGRYNPNERITSERRLALGSIGTTPLPLVTFRRKSSYLGAPVAIAGIDVIVDGDSILELRLDASLTGASYGTPTGHTATETAVEADVAATAVTGGEILWTGRVSASGSGSLSKGFRAGDVPGAAFVEALPVTLTVRKVTGTGGTASAICRVREEW